MGSWGLGLFDLELRSSSPAKAGDPVNSAVSELSAPLVFTGCPAFAGHDELGRASRPQLFAREARAVAHRRELGPDHGRVHLGRVSRLRGEAAVGAGDDT